MFYAWLFGSAVIGYFLGSLPFGAMVARAHGVDIFKEGSSNPGATNVKRVLGEKFGAKGKRAGNLVFALDVLKGAIASAWSVFSWTSLSVSVDLQNGSGAAVISGQDWRLLGLAGVVGAITAIGLFVIIRHRSNITRLLNGTENKFAKKPPAQP